MAIQTADLLLMGEFRRRYTDETAAANLTTADKLRLRELLASASDFWTTHLCGGRRFDRRVETRYYTPRHLTSLYGGDLQDSYTLILDDDLQSLTTIVNGDDTTISSDYTLLPQSRGNLTAHRIIALNRFTSSGVYWKRPTSPNTDPLNTLEITGVWGWGGEWETISGSTVVDDPLTDSATTLNVTTSTGAANYEQEMTLKIGSEYLRVTADPSADAISVERGYNGSTAAAHVAGTAIAYFRADDTVRQNILRLVSWRIEQGKSPMFGQTVVADITIPTVVETAPKDVVAAGKRLMAPARIVGV